MLFVCLFLEAPGHGKITIFRIYKEAANKFFFIFLVDSPLRPLDPLPLGLVDKRTDTKKKKKNIKKSSFSLEDQPQPPPPVGCSLMEHVKILALLAEL